MKDTPNSLIDVLRWRAKNQPRQLSYRFLEDGESGEVSITYEELDRQARSIAATLQACTKAGDRALLLLPAGLDFMAGYFGCLYASVIPVPVPAPHPARLEKSMVTILRLVDDATPSVALLSAVLFDAINLQKPTHCQFNTMKLLVTGATGMENLSEKWKEPKIKSNDIALLQYTSGSTTAPKGVMVTHNNLLHNLGVIARTFGQTSKSESVTWLPPYHDMGLIGGLLLPLYVGFPVTIIPHLLFLQRPLRWLQAISRYHATTSGGPSFAYDLCTRKIKPEQLDQLDLSNWEVAFNGAEPVYHKTMKKFEAYFAPCGFRMEAFSPCYGLAESTLMVVGSNKGHNPVTQNLSRLGLEENKAIISTANNGDTQTLVGCGTHEDDQRIEIVDVATLLPCQPGQIGEIWISGASVASGYWNDPVASAATFGAHFPGNEEGPFLRTGDLGFFDEGELYVTGRLKNLIIIDGKNFYPQDIERTVEQSHDAIQPAGCAVFSIPHSGNENVIVVAETRHRPVANTAEIIRAVRKAVSEHHDLHVYDIRLCFQGGIPRSTSGKIRHFLCKKNYISGSIKEIASL